MQYIGSNIRFIFTKIKELMNSHNTDTSAHSELFKSWTLLRDPTNAEIADALAVTHKNGRGDVLVHVANTQTFALEDMKLFFRPARLQLISANESNYEGIYITMDGTQGRYVAKIFADSEIMTPEGPSTISTPSELVLYPAASDAVLYTPQTLTEAQQAQARDNIGALDVNIKTTPVDIGVGLGSTVYYVQSGWLRPCPDNADKELKLQYRRVFEFIGSQYLKPDSQNMLLQAKSAYALYQKSLASESIKATYNPLAAEQVYVTWKITTISNKHYFYYAQVSTAYQYTCTYCVEDDALVTETYERPVYRAVNGVGEQDSVSQFRMSAAPTEDMHIATKQYVDIAKTEAQQLGLTTATPGQIIKVKTVQDGKPTEWEAVDMPGGDKWEKIKEITIAEGAEESNALTINADENGNTFRLKKARLCAKFPAYTGTSTIPNYSFAMINGKTTGRITPLLYTYVWPKISTNKVTGTIYYVDVSGAQQIEHAQRSGNSSWSDGTYTDYLVYGAIPDTLATIYGDTLWAKPITSIGGTGMLIYPGCHFVLYGVRE